MRTPSKIITALALAGLAVAGGAAFTAGGVVNAHPDQWIGGAVTQNITGAHVSTIAYTPAALDLTKTTVHEVVVTFADEESDGKTVALAFSGSDVGSFVNQTVPTGAGDNFVTFTSTSTDNDAAGITAATITVSGASY